MFSIIKCENINKNHNDNYITTHKHTQQNKPNPTTKLKPQLIQKITNHSEVN
jgi:hypothetical protein